MFIVYIEMRKQGDLQQKIYKWRIIKYLNDTKEIELSNKLYKTIKEVIIDYPDLNQHRVCNHLRGLSKGVLGKSKDVFSDICIEKIRI
jgi:hypothetical protein